MSPEPSAAAADAAGVVEVTVAELLAGDAFEVGPSPWVEIDQARIDAFAAATLDPQWIHVDPERAAAGPFGTTIAHGYLVLSLLPHMVEAALHVTDRAMGVNYGINRLRFTAPVPVGSAVRLRGRLAGARPRGAAAQMELDVEVEVRGSDKPALVGQIVFLQYPADDAGGDEEGGR